MTTHGRPMQASISVMDLQAEQSCRRQEQGLQRRQDALKDDNGDGQQKSELPERSNSTADVSAQTGTGASQK